MSSADLRARLATPSREPLFAAGVWDGMSARVAAASGFEGLFVSGFAVAASMGLPDADLYSKADVLRAVGLASSVGLPTIADMDTGWGDVAGTYFATKDFGKSGASAVLIEDQISPKPGPLSEQRHTSLVPIPGFSAKIAAAADAASGGGPLIIARSDARDNGELLERCVAYAEAGADLIFPMRSDADLPFETWQQIARSTQRPLVAAVAPDSWLERELTSEVAADVGIGVVIYGLQGLLTTCRALDSAYTSLRQGRFDDVNASGFAIREVTSLMGFGRVEAIRNQHQPVTQASLDAHPQDE